MTVTLNVCHGAAFVDEKDRERAKAAALKVFEAFAWRGERPTAIDAAEAQAAFARHISDEDYQRTSRDTLLIAAWEAAQSAADIALTEGWRDPGRAHCEISVNTQPSSREKETS